MAPGKVGKPRLVSSERPFDSEIKTLSLVLTPKTSLFESSAELGPLQEGLRDQRRYGAVRLLGPTPELRSRPILEIESSVERPLTATSLVQVRKAELVPKESAAKIWWEENKVSIVLKSTFAGLVGLYGSLFYLFPISMAWIVGGSFLAMLGIGTAFWVGSQPLKDAMHLGRQTLAKLMSLPQRLLPGKRLPALPAGWEGEGPFRSASLVLDRKKISALIRKVQTTIIPKRNYREVSDRQREIRRLAEFLQGIPPDRPEFRQGIDVLLKVALKPPVARYSFHSWRNHRSSLSQTALEELSSIFALLPSAPRDPNLRSIAARALEKWNSSEMLRYFFRNEFQDRAKLLQRHHEISRNFE